MNEEANRTQQQGIARQPQLDGYVERCYVLREALKPVGEEIKAMMKHPAANPTGDTDRDIGEMKANIMLAYRHIEDARMRLGKAVQAADGGTSCYQR